MFLELDRILHDTISTLVIVSILYVIIELESVVQITSTHTKSDAVCAVLSLTPFTVLPY